MKKRIFALLTSAVLLTGCASSEAVLTYRDHTITENEFTYYLATYKARFMQAYSDFKDTAEFYASTLGEDGMTAEDFLFESALHNVKMTLVCDVLAEEAGLTVSDSTVDAIDSYLDDFITEYAGGSKTQFNQSLAQYGINAAMLREIYLRDERGTLLMNALYGQNGTVGLTDADRAAYLNDNYVRVRHIYVNNAYTYVTDENGYVVTNTDGTYQTIALSGDALDEKNAVIAQIDAALASGEAFDTVYATYSEDQLYQNGYYITRNMNFVSDVVTSAFDLPIGESVKITSEVGTHYIMRMEMDESPWDDEGNADFFTDYEAAVTADLFTTYIESHIDEVEVNEEILDGFSMEASPVNYRF